MRILNLTPHPVVLTTTTGDVTLEPGGSSSRVAVQSVPVGAIGVESVVVPLVREHFGLPAHLPEPASDTLLVVSRMVAEACPDREDLVCPTRLVRDEQGSVIGASALAVGRAFEAGVPDHLVVLAGGNPLPNLQAIATLAPRRVDIVASQQTIGAAHCLKAAAVSLDGRIDVEVRVVDDANDRASVIAALESLETGWALSYTGGTKVMSAQARLAYERWGDGRAAHASVVDGRIRFDDGRQQPLSTTRINLEALARLHGHRLVGGTGPVTTVADLRTVEEQLRHRIKRGSAKTARRANDPALANLPPSSSALLTGEGGRWLESMVGAFVALVADEVLVNPRLWVGGRSAAAPELDVLARVGWSVVLLSCTVETTRAARKLKLMEAQRRAEQLGGQRAVAGLVCLEARAASRGLAEDVIAASGLHGRALVFGRAEMLECLSGNRAAIRALVGATED